MFEVWRDDVIGRNYTQSVFYKVESWPEEFSRGEKYFRENGWAQFYDDMVKYCRMAIEMGLGKANFTAIFEAILKELEDQKFGKLENK